MTLSDTQVRDLINREFVPCWTSVRPVPKVTIDFGNGKKLQRTLTGNTVISICLPDGQPVDALPGVYTPDDFRGIVNGTLEWIRGTRLLDQPAEAVPAMIQEWHRVQVNFAAADAGGKRPMTVSKMVVESPILRAFRLNPPRHPAPIPAEVATARAQQQTVADPAEMARKTLDLLADRLEDISKEPYSAEEIKQRFPPLGHEPTPAEFGQLSLRLDSRTNVTLVRPAIHLLFGTYAHLPAENDCANDIYTRVLHVPVNDPFMGLTASALPGTPNGQ